MKTITFRRPVGHGKGRQVTPEAGRRVSDLLAGHGPLRRDRLIEYLHAIQDGEGCLPQALLAALADALKLSQVEVFEVASFYHHFEILKDGQAGPALTVRVCDGLLPRIGSDFGLTPGAAGGVILFFSVAYGLSQMVFGPLGDRWGKARLVCFGLLACMVIALVAAASADFPLLLLARAAWGIAAAGIIPLSMAWIGDAVPYEERQATLARTAEVVPDLDRERPGHLLRRPAVRAGLLVRGRRGGTADARVLPLARRRRGARRNDGRRAVALRHDCARGEDDAQP
jgi:hypothetical protein